MVEGEKAEPILLENVLKRYGFNCIKTTQQAIDGSIELDVKKFVNGYNNVVIAQAAKNMISSFLKLVEKYKYFDFNNALTISDDGSLVYAGVFMIFDVDHTAKDVLSNAMRKFNNENEGLLLVSSPCIEVMADYGREKELEIKEHVKEYKKELNRRYPNGALQYIIGNFESLAIKFLDQNRKDFNEENIMNHPQLVVDAINSLNTRNADGSALYRYFTTVIYVAIAYLHGLTREISNYSAVREFFISKNNGTLG